MRMALLLLANSDHTFSNMSDYPLLIYLVASIQHSAALCIVINRAFGPIETSKDLHTDIYLVYHPGTHLLAHARALLFVIRNLLGSEWKHRRHVEADLDWKSYLEDVLWSAYTYGLSFRFKDSLTSMRLLLTVHMEVSTSNGGPVLVRSNLWNDFDHHRRIRHLRLVGKEHFSRNLRSEFSCHRNPRHLSLDAYLLLNRMIKQESKRPPPAISVTSRQRLRTEGPDGEAPTIASAAPKEDAQEISDMWDMPFLVSEDAWAVTRCLEDHGSLVTNWSAAHFVAVAMWSGGITAGIQAARAIRIFRIWSPHAEDNHAEPPSIKVKTKRKHILSKIWPLDEYEQKPLLDRANRLRRGKPFANFDEAHDYLLRLCIGPDLTRFPTVVRPRLQRIDWQHLVTETQFCRTLAPILYKYFDHRVDLASASEPIVGSAIDGRILNAYAGSYGYATVKEIKAGGRNRPRSGYNREKDLPQTDDNEDDDEDFELGPNGSAVKKESGFSDKDDIEILGQRSCIQGREHNNASHSNVKDEYEEHDFDTVRSLAARSAANAYSTGEARTLDLQSSIIGRNDEIEVDTSRPLLTRSANQAAVPVVKFNSTASEESSRLNKQVINQLYERTCGMPSYRILSFSKSHNSLPALPNYWIEIWEYREHRDAFVSGSKRDLPWPCESSAPVPSPSSHGLLKIRQEKALIQHAKDDLVKIERSCNLIIID